MKTVLTINDEFISILVFKTINNKPFYLYDETINVENSEIKMNCIINNQSIKEKILHLINNASKFIAKTVNEIYLSVDINKLNIEDYHKRVGLNDKILNKEIWKKISQVQIKQQADQQILRLDTIKWNINGLNIYKLDKTYNNVEYVDVYGKVCLLNKTIYNNLVQIFESINIKIVEFIPTVMNFKTLSRSDEITNYEMISYLSKNFLTFVLLQGNHIIEIHNISHLGIDCLINEIMNVLNIQKYGLVFKWLNDLNSFIFNLVTNINFVINYQNKPFNIKSKNNIEIYQIVRRYVEELKLIFKEQFQKFKNQNINVSYVHLLSHNLIGEQLLNLVRPNINIDNRLINVYSENFLNYKQNLNLIYSQSIFKNDTSNFESSDFQPSDDLSNNEYKGV